MNIKRKRVVEHIDLIQEFCDRNKVGWNKACDDIGDQEFLGTTYLSNIETEEQLLNYTYSKGYRLLRDIMIENNIKQIRIISGDD